MLYTNVPLPKPLVDRIDKVVSDPNNSYRSRPDFILHHIRMVLTRIENEKFTPD